MDFLDEAGILIRVVDEGMEVIAGLTTHEEGIGQDLIGAGIGGFGERRDSPVFLLVRAAGVVTIAGVGLAKILRAGVIGVIKGVVSIEGVIEHGGISVIADGTRGGRVISGVDSTFVTTSVSSRLEAHEALEEGGIVEAIVGGDAGRVVIDIVEIHDAAVEVVLAGDGARVAIGGIVRIGQEHLGVSVIAGGGGIYDGLVTIDAERQEVLD